MAIKLSLISVIRPKVKINPSELGYIRPDKSIVFQTSEAAQTYAKNVVIKELHGKNPYEKGVILKDNIILKELDGDASSIDLNSANFSLDSACGATFVHGHPTMINGNTTPLSIMDFVMQCAYKFKTMIAYNANGEICKLEEASNKDKLAKFLPNKVSNAWDNILRVFKMKRAFSEYVKMWASLLPENMRSYIEPLFHSSYPDSFIVDKSLVAAGKEIRKDRALAEQIGKKEQEILTSDKGQKAIHDFWVKNAENYGYKYSTNFSNLNS